MRNSILPTMLFRAATTPLLNVNLPDKTADDSPLPTLAASDSVGESAPALADMIDASSCSSCMRQVSLDPTAMSPGTACRSPLQSS